MVLKVQGELQLHSLVRPLREEAPRGCSSAEKDEGADQPGQRAAGAGDAVSRKKEAKRAAPGRRQKAPSKDQGTRKTKKASVAPKEAPKVISELLLSRDGELRSIEEELSEYVRYCYGHLSKFPFFSLSPCPFSQSSFRTDS